MKYLKYFSQQIGMCNVATVHLQTDSILIMTWNLITAETWVSDGTYSVECSLTFSENKDDIYLQAVPVVTAY